MVSGVRVPRRTLSVRPHPNPDRDGLARKGLDRNGDGGTLSYAGRSSYRYSPMAKNESIVVRTFQLGRTYSRLEIARAGQVTEPAGSRDPHWSTGIVPFTNAVLLLVTLDKANKPEYPLRRSIRRADVLVAEPEPADTASAGHPADRVGERACASVRPDYGKEKGTHAPVRVLRPTR